MPNLSTLRSFGRFLATRKRYWLVPLVLVLALFATLLVLADGSAAAPFIYTLF